MAFQPFSGALLEHSTPLAARVPGCPQWKLSKRSPWSRVEAEREVDLTLRLRFLSRSLFHAHHERLCR